MTIDKDLAMKMWHDIFGDVQWAYDCFETRMNKNAYSNEPVQMRDPDGSGKYYDYSWNLDHIRPKSSFSREADADFLNNLEPMHRQNNLAKSDNYPRFIIDQRQYRVVSTNYGYGIVDSYGRRIDWKKDGRHYQ